MKDNLAFEQTDCESFEQAAASVCNRMDALEQKWDSCYDLVHVFTSMALENYLVCSLHNILMRLTIIQNKWRSSWNSKNSPKISIISLTSFWFINQRGSQKEHQFIFIFLVF